MRLKIIAAIIALVIVGAVLFAATAAAFMIPSYKGNTASNSGSTGNGPYWFGESEDDFRQGGTNIWGSSSQKGTVPYFDDDWSGHR